MPDCWRISVKSRYEVIDLMKVSGLFNGYSIFFTVTLRRRICRIGGRILRLHSSCFLHCIGQ
jgi:hypothetical protein